MTTPDSFAIGDEVRAPFCGLLVEAEVIADLGSILFGGRRLLRVRVFDAEDYGCPDEFEVPENRVLRALPG